MKNNLLKACRNRDGDLIESILEANDKDVNLKDDFGNTALHYVCGFGDTELAEKLISRGGKVDAENTARETPLHLAAQGGNTALVRLLRERGADFNAQTREGMTPLVYAVRNRKPQTARLLISLGADRFLRTSNSLSALDYIKSEGLDELLVFFGDDFPIRDAAGNSPLHQAVFEGSLPEIRRILSATALADASANTPADASPVNKPNKQGLTPLLIAVSKLNYDVSDLLLSFGASPNAVRPGDGFTPLHIAALNGAKWLAEILIEHGADVNELDGDGATPLIIAVRSQQRDFAALLLRNNASRTIADKNGKTAGDYAKESQFPEIRELLNLPKGAAKPGPARG